MSKYIIGVGLKKSRLHTRALVTPPPPSKFSVILTALYHYIPKKYFEFYKGILYPLFGHYP